MKPRNWKSYAELIGIVAIVASLLFVGMQLRQDRQLAEFETLAAEQMADLELARFLEEKGGIWRKGLADEPLSEDEQVSFDLLAYALYSKSSYNVRRGITLRGAVVERDGRSYAYFVYANPGLRKWFDALVDVQTLRSRAYDLPEEIRYYPQIVAEHLRILDEKSPETPEQNYSPY